MSYRENPRSTTGANRNGVLTDSQREFLLSDATGYTDQNKRDYYDAIRDRVHNTLLDFTILFDHWPEDERDEVFDSLMEEDDSADWLIDLFAFLYSATGVSGAFKDTLKSGVRKAEYRKSSLEIPRHAIQPKFEVERFPKVDLSAVDKYRDGPEGIAELTGPEARMLLNALYVDDTLWPQSMVEAELRFQKFLDGEPPEELEEFVEQSKAEAYEDMKKYREQK